MYLLWSHHKTVFPMQDHGVSMYVRSAPSEFDLRTSIRATWASLCDRLNIRVVFFVGWSLQPEVNQRLVEELTSQDDLVVLPMIDHYRNLTLKQLLIFEWHYLHTNDLPFPVVSDQGIYD